MCILKSAGELYIASIYPPSGTGGNPTCKSADLKQFIETPNGQEENTSTSGYVLSRAVLPQRYKLEHSEPRALPPCQNLDAQPVDDRAVPVW